MKSSFTAVVIQALPLCSKIKAGEVAVIFSCPHNRVPLLRNSTLVVPPGYRKSRKIWIVLPGLPATSVVFPLAAVSMFTSKNSLTAGVMKDTEVVGITASHASSLGARLGDWHRAPPARASLREYRAAPA